MLRRLVITLQLMAPAALAAAAPAAHADVSWLCRPGLAQNPCDAAMATTVVSPEGASSTVTGGRAARPRIDCFYVYPTVSEQPTANADKRVEAAETAIAAYQASRFSQRCRVFAPMYRQGTLSGALVPVLRTGDALKLALADVEEAFAAYLREDNHGRGFVLLGHSQGSRLLRTLIRDVVDPDRSLRRRMVSAIIPGANVKVPVGRDVGGDFAHIRPCRSSRQLHCVVAWSAFDEAPPPDSRFGRSNETAPDPLGMPVGPRYEVLCTNPADLAANQRTPLRTLARTESYPGVIGLGLTVTWDGSPPAAPTPWVVPRDHYTGRCEDVDGADVLMIESVGAARHLTPVPQPTWGLHLLDMNLPLGDLVTLVHRQEVAFLRSRR